MGTEYVQDELPLFGEPVLPGDYVRVKELIDLDGMGAGDDFTDIGASSHVDDIGQVIDLETNHLYPYAVRFQDGAEFMYHRDELERQS